MGHDTDNTISGGIFFSSVIQGRDITVVLPPQITPAMAGLRAASAAFTGRGSELSTLLEVLAPRHDGDGPADGGSSAGTAGVQAVVVTAVGGMGGVGKTELALQAAHLALKRGWFAGGILFVDMFGYDPDRRLTAAQAASGFVRALGIPAEHVPAEAQELERLLRSVLDAYATQGHPVLVVVDNVSDHQQAAPLLPAHPACRAIVTSRHTQSRLGARLVDLDVLDIGESVELVRRALEVTRPDDRRIVEHPEDGRRLAESCGGLPLALQIVAALLADLPSKPLAEMVTDLNDPATRLTELRYGNEALTSVFDLSYKHLPPGHARLFRLLSVNPGPEISTAAAAALADLGEAETRRGLEALARAHLIEAGSSDGRWRMHDLVRLHSAQHGGAQAEADQRPEALTRLLEHYLATTRAANAHFDPAVDDPSQLGFRTREQALAWLDVEFPNLTAATYAAAADPDHRAAARDFPASMRGFLQLRRHFNDWIRLSQTAIAAAEALHDHRGQATALTSLGVALDQLQRSEEAIDAHQKAVQMCQDVGDLHGEGNALNNLGIALQEVGRFGEAVAAHEQDLQIRRVTGDRHGEARALDNLGAALQEEVRFEEAIAAHQTAVQIFRDTGDRQSEVQALGNLGLALSEVGRFEEAIRAHQDVIQFFRDLGDRHSEGMALGNLGITLNEAGRFEEAITAHQTALQIFRDTGDRRGEGMVLDTLGLALRKAGRSEEAITAFQNSVQILHETGDRYNEEAVRSDLQETRQSQDDENGKCS